MYRLQDYKPYPYLISHIYLDFSINDEFIEVVSTMNIEPKREVENNDNKLLLKGKDINLIKIEINKIEIPKELFSLDKDSLVINKVPLKPFILKIKSRFNPYKNSSLEGIYESSGIITSQCEAEGFRRICFHPDRPDVLSKYKVRIEANRYKYPILLSNGNKVSENICNNNPERHEVIWLDPIPKPSYLFALVAGNLIKLNEKYKSNVQDIDINIFVEKGDEIYTKHAFISIKKAIKWEEEEYKLKYDLKSFNIVAIRHFNMGAMENKGLNIFNSKLILANSEIATDDELERIESVIAHEYFHNWTGNRITCRDWFQLSLKEGLTVFRDQSFTSDLHSETIKRIEDVSFLRSTQFKEDAGPTSHPVKPSEYIAIDNFYTTTIYEKGAEIIRMLQTLLGKKYFMDGISNYIKQNDGKATTTENFVYSIFNGAEINGYKNNIDIKQFTNWYYQNGTPHVKIKRNWDNKNKILEIIVEQFNTNNLDKEKSPLTIPIKLSILNCQKNNKVKLLVLDKNKQSFKFKTSTNNKTPIISIFRQFSAPVTWESDLDSDEILYLASNDNDLFSRWEAIQTIFIKTVLKRCNGEKDEILENQLIEILKINIDTYKDCDLSFLTVILSLPKSQEIESYQKIINPIKLDESYNFIINKIAKNLSNILEDLLFYLTNFKNQEWPNGKYERKLIGIIWYLLIIIKKKDVMKTAMNSVDKKSMTLSRAGLNALKSIECPEREKALENFYNRWKNNGVVLDTWFSIQASIKRTDSIKYVKELMYHEKFDALAPNSIRAVLGGFIQNKEGFHNLKGEGYSFIAKQICLVDKRNPITASRIMKIFNRWESYDEPFKNNMKNSIKYILDQDISENTREVVSQLSKNIKN